MIDRRTALLSLLCASAPLPALARPAAKRFTDFAGGVVSLTYDDGLDSHLDIAVPALGARGLQGTFYVTWENIAERAAEWQGVIAKGHELANHTVTHPCGISGRNWRTYGRRELAPLNRQLDAWYGTQARRDFAYPCDVTDLGPGTPNQQLARFEAVLRRQGIASARTSEGPPNSADWARNHPFRLHALAAGANSHDLSQLADYIRRAQAEGKWAILVFHEIVPGNPGWIQTSTQLHDALLDLIVKEGIRCRRVCDVMGDLAG